MDHVCIIPHLPIFLWLTFIKIFFFMYVCSIAAMATSKYCHVMLFICAQVVSRRAQGNVMVNTILRMYVDYHIYWQYSYMEQET